MADTTQQFIDSLITTIANAEDPESVTNEMVAQVMDFLNKSYKDLLTNNTGIMEEAATRSAADEALQRSINTLQTALEAVQAKATDAKNKADANATSINTILGKNASAAIESFNEVIAFLSGVKDNETLTALLMDINDQLAGNSDDINTLQNERDILREDVDKLQAFIKLEDAKRLNDAVTGGIYAIPGTILNSQEIVVVRTGMQLAQFGSGKTERPIIQYWFSTSGLQFRKGSLVTESGVTTTEWEDWQGVGQKGAGNLINVTELVPPENGFYDLASAVEAVPATHRALGRWITYRLGTGEWETKQFKGSSVTQWQTLSAWEDTGGKGKITGVKLNGAAVEPDAEGIVNLTVDEVEVDDSLNAQSTNPVQNNVVTGKLNEIEANTVANMDAKLSDDETEVHIALLNKSGNEIAGVDVPVGSGSAGGDQGQTAKIVLSASVDNPIIREGSPVKLTYFFDHQYLGGDQGGESTGQRADIAVTVKNGAVTMFETTYNDVARGSYELDITSFVKAGTTDITVKATVTDPETGNKRSRQAAAQVSAKTLALSSSYSLANSIAGGGYGPNDTAVIPFTVSGSGSKTVTLYLDGNAYDSKTVNKSGKTNGSFAVPMTGLTLGRHNVQLVADMEASDTLTLVSESIYIDLLKKDAAGHVSAPFIGTMIVFPDGRIFDADHYKTPTLEIGQFERLDFDFVVYDPETTPADMAIYHDGALSQTVSARRTVQSYTNRFTEYGTEAMMFKTGATEYPFTIEVVESSIALAEITDSLRVKLTAAGRSNNEGNPDRWTYEDVTATFTGFDWSSNGWTGDALSLTNGAAVEINHAPFATDATANGLTLEAEIKCSNVFDREGVVLDCMAGGVGVQMTAEQAKIVASGGQELETKFAPDTWIKVGFVIQSKADDRLLSIFVNGIRDRALQYNAASSLMQGNPANIRITSDAADVEVRNVKIFDRALTDDEMLANYMIDRQTADEMVLLFQRNDILNDETDAVDIDKLRAQGKAVMRIVGDVNLVNQTNNKKFEVPVTVYYYSPYGKEYDFVAYNVGLRIQGTSSTTYPRKNYRIYFQRLDKYEGCRLEVNGVNVPDMTYSFKPGARPVSIWCLKADFSDSSSTHNTGAVRIVNDIFKRCGWLTPPQAAYKGAYDVRIGVDGYPINLFYDNDGTGVSVFLGKYNFNNEKSDSHTVYGFEGIEGFNDEKSLAGERNKCICIEFLNNSAALCLFGTADMSNFDNDELEFRFKPDEKWSTAHADDKAAITRLWAWIQACKGNPTKFRNEYKDYFLNESPFAWYVVTDYFMAVDNRAKNMMLATWDGIHWMFIPYDMDTLFGERNDSMLKFAYYITFDSYDDSQGAYCFAGHDSVLWELVRACPDKLAEVAATIRSNMSTEYVLSVFNDEMMASWSERVYNKDGEYKYILPLIEEGRNYLYALQGSRHSHRTHTIVNRFALLDSIYCAGTYRSNAFPVYFSYNFAADNRVIKLTAAERFAFGYGYSNGSPTVSGQMAEAADELITLTLAQNLIVNDPQNVYGADRIRTLDLSDVAHAIVGTLNLNKCTRLLALNARCRGGQNTLTNIVLDECRNLKELDVNGLKGLTALSLNNQKKLESFVATDTNLTNVIFAAGGKLKRADLPATLQTLELRYLADLKLAGLNLPEGAAVTRLVVDACPGVPWKELLAKCPQASYLRVTGINETGRGDLLRSLMTMNGVDENGANVNTCRLVGIYQLTQYLEADELAALVAHFPELNIKQPEWTGLKYDETVSDSPNVTNLDNQTGYEYGNEFVASAHVSAILAKRHRVMAKYVAENKALVCPLDDTDSRKYHDGTEANLNGFNHTTKPDEGDFMMYEPLRWCKGVDDFINRCHYHFYSSNKDVATPDGRRLTLAELEVADKTAVRVSSLYNTLDTAQIVYDDFRAITVPVAGYKQVRWPAVSSTVYGAVFLDTENNIIGRAAANNGRMTNASYLFATVPEGAVKMVFTYYMNEAFSFVWLTTSAEIHAIEPDAWQAGGYLAGVNKAHYANNQIRSICGVAPTVSTSQAQFMDYCKRRGKGFTPITYGMHRDIACLFWATYGDRDSSKICGYGSGSNTTQCGLTAFLGMRDTINPQHSAQYGYYYDENGTLRSATSINALGYDNLWGNVAEWLGDDTRSDYYVWTVQDNGERKIKSATVSDSWIVELYNGRFMDVVPVVVGGTETTHYADKFWCQNSPARVVYRSYGYASANGGVAFAYADYDSAITNAIIGSRLAFIGEIEYTTDVEAFLKAEMVG